MARDNSPKERQKKDLARKAGRRAPADRILIVTEGKKTEPNYFAEIRAAYKLHGANVVVMPSTFGSDPASVVKCAKSLFKDGSKGPLIRAKAFDQVIAVFDRDDHATYHEALNMADELNKTLINDDRKKVVFRAVASVPSFEFWLLLHYKDVHAPIHRDEVMRRLKIEYPGYGKGINGVFAHTSDNLPAAIKRAAGLAKMHTARDEPEPYTGIGELVELLLKLRQ